MKETTGGDYEIAFSSIGVLADCDCTTTSMRADKMKYEDFGAEMQHVQV